MDSDPLFLLSGKVQALRSRLDRFSGGCYVQCVIKTIPLILAVALWAGCSSSSELQPDASFDANTRDTADASTEDSFVPDALVPDSSVPQIASSNSLAIDGTSLYWVDQSRSAVVRAPRGGGEIEELSPGIPSAYAPIALFGTTVVWMDQTEVGLRLMRTSVSGGPSVVLAPGNGGPVGVAVDAERAYFSRSNDEGEPSVLSVRLDTGEEAVVSSGLVGLALALYGDDLVGTRCSEDGVWRVSRDGGEPTAIASNAFCPISVVVNDEYVYVGRAGEGAGVFRAPIAGGNATRVAPGDGSSFAVHRGFVYSFSEGSLVRTSIEGSGSTPISASAQTAGIAVDDQFVYWIETPTGEVSNFRFAPLPE